MELLNPESFGRDIKSRIVMDQMKVDNLRDSIKDSIQSMISDFNQRVILAGEVLEAGNPDNILTRGYAVVYDKNGKIIRDVSALNTGELISVKAAKGTIDAEIKSVREGH